MKTKKTTKKVSGKDLNISKKAITGPHKKSAKLLRDLRKEGNKSQQDFSKIFKVSQSHYSKMESGIQEINVPVAKILNKKFKVPAEKILSL